MKLLSMYLNPYQPYPERNLGTEPDGTPRSAVEDNLSRAVFSSLSGAHDSRALVGFLESLMPTGASPFLAARFRCVMSVLAESASDDIEVGLQGWPDRDLPEPPTHRLLVGASSSHADEWTFDKRRAPESPCIDAWVRVPGKALIAFEFKTDEHPLDATQMSAYAHELGLLEEADGVPRAAPGASLKDATQARRVQSACRDVVADISWSELMTTLRRVQTEDPTTDWLVRQAVEYLSSHVRPPYRGAHTIVEWLDQADNAARRAHLRALVADLGDALATSNDPVAVQLGRRGGSWDIAPGAAAAAYAPLVSASGSLETTWLGRSAQPVLWFAFRCETRPRVGLEFYVQAEGAQPHLSSTQTAVEARASWNSVPERARQRRDALERRLDQWAAHAPTTCRVSVSAVGFKGKKTTWQGGGASADGPTLQDATPLAAAAFLKEHGDALWMFPTVDDSEDIPQAALHVRKPALSLVAPLDIEDFREAGDDAEQMQRLLRRALDHILPVLQLQ